MRSITHYRPHCQQPYTHTAGGQQCQETAVWQQIDVPTCMHMCTHRHTHIHTQRQQKPHALKRKLACVYTLKLCAHNRKAGEMESGTLTQRPFWV